MSEQTKWTPGPWEAELSEAETGESISISAEGSYLATVLNAEEFPCVDESDIAAIDAETRARAVLIAAAPDLYAALDRLTAIAVCVSDGEFWRLQVAPYLPEAIRAAQSALAKARGEKA